MIKMTPPPPKYPPHQRWGGGGRGGGPPYLWLRDFHYIYIYIYIMKVNIFLLIFIYVIIITKNMREREGGAWEGGEEWKTKYWSCMQAESDGWSEGSVKPVTNQSGNWVKFNFWSVYFFIACFYIWWSSLYL
nr:hypothetical protein [Morchella crassipes]